jgi:hypothetical protein
MTPLCFTLDLLKQNCSLDIWSQKKKYLKKNKGGFVEVVFIFTFRDGENNPEFLGSLDSFLKKQLPENS